MTTWIPTTEQVRYGYSCDPEAEYRDPIGAPAQQREAARAFDRWLAEERRAVAEKAWGEGRESLALDVGRPLGDDGMRPVTPNPYRAKETMA